MPTPSNRTITVLLNRNVESLGIVGDVVKVKPGYARNFLLPLGIGEAPTDERVAALQSARAEANAEVQEIRAKRKTIIGALEEMTATLVRSCNDRGVLYGSVTQRDISDALVALGHGVDERAIRLANPIRRIGDYPVTIQFEKDLRAEILVIVEADRSLSEESEEMEFDNEGELIEPSRRRKPKAAESGSEESAEETSENTDAETETAEA
ncbi:MAG: 50S ribosomal protein L9 [Planctomycetota bacterium]|jgi:large subunit ribosomal protein L9|nr:50S ribosomal protein L9 [Planctomycetota bacterium]MDA1025443.1 50S ribosomal protein L9 [Planctomycetota bacterium]